MSIKKLLVLSLLLCLHISLFPQSGPDFGDVDWNGFITIVDALLIAQYYVGYDLPGFYTSVADVNCDGEINIIDAFFVAQYYVGMLDDLPCSTPSPIPTLAPTPEPTDPPGTGEVMVNPELTSVTSGESFCTGIKVNSGLHGYYHFESGVFFDSSILTVDTSSMINGVGSVTDTTISSVEVSNGFIRITGERSSEEPYDWNSFYIFWIASPVNEGTTMLDLVVYELTDEDNETIGNPEGIPGYVEVTYTTPTPTPSPDPTPDSTPVPTAGPEITPVDSPKPTPETTVTPTPEPENLTVDIVLPSSNSWGGIYHWIPNTGDIFGPFKIKITVENAPSGSPFTNDSMFLDILPPLDDSFSSSESGTSNIRKNQGTCQYVFYGLYRNNKSPKVLKIFKLNSSIVNSADRYKTVYSESGGSVVIGKDGYVYHDYDGDIEDVEEMNFGIGIREDTGTIRPGDDLRFRFGLLYYPEYKTTATAGDFVTVYDHKLLWRANLFLNEGTNDWNNLNPWNDSKNRWNAAGNGKQIALTSWTTANTDGAVSSAVAYAFGCCDSPFNFIADLNDQKEYIQEYYSNSNPLWTVDNPNPHPGWAQWDQTTAPGGDWDNYRPESYIPNLAEYKRRNGGFTYEDMKHSAGVDCTSFIKRAANYGGVIVGYPATIDDMDRDTIDRAPFRDNYGTIEIRANCWKVYVRNADTNDDPNDDHLDDIALRNLIVPGDYVEIDNHSALVGKITFTNGRNTDTARITIIEATTFDNEWYIQNDQLLSQYGNDFIAIWRFMQNE